MTDKMGIACLEELKKAIETGQPKYTERLVLQALEESIRPSRILNEALIPAIHSVGDYYRSDETDIPQILLSARCMRVGLDLLEPQLERWGRHYQGKIILGTVEGDLHDIGKNLVAVMMRSVGFKVLDLGVDVLPEQFIDALQSNPEVNIVCISCLLTPSIVELRTTVQAIRQVKSLSHIKIMVGGGAISEAIAQKMGAVYTGSAIEAADRAKELAREMGEKA